MQAENVKDTASERMEEARSAVGEKAHEAKETLTGAAARASDKARRCGPCPARLASAAQASTHVPCYTLHCAVGFRESIFVLLIPVLTHHGRLHPLALTAQVVQEAHEAGSLVSDKAEGAAKAAASTAASALGAGSDAAASASFALQDKREAAEAGSTKARALYRAEDVAADTSQYLAEKADSLRDRAGEYDDPQRSKVLPQPPPPPPRGARAAGDPAAADEEEEGTTLHSIALVQLPVHARAAVAAADAGLLCCGGCFFRCVLPWVVCTGRSS